MQIDSLEARLLLFERVVRRAVVCKPALQLGSKSTAVRVGCIPRQAVREPDALEMMLERLLGQPALEICARFRKFREAGDKAPSRARGLAQLVQRARRDHAPAPHDGDPVRHQLGLAQHVGGDDEGCAARPLLAQVAAHVGGGDRIEPRGRLVAEDPVGLVQSGSDQRHLLSHSA